MKIVVSGDRNWIDRKKITDILSSYDTSLLIHGGCRGLDILAGEIAKERGISVKVYPADWKKYGLSAGPIRNEEMLRENPDLVILFHSSIETSKGTKNMKNLCEKKGIKYLLVK